MTIDEKFEKVVSQIGLVGVIEEEFDSTEEWEEIKAKLIDKKSDSTTFLKTRIDNAISEFENKKET